QPPRRVNLKGLGVFVPEGLIDRTLAVYCLGSVRKRLRLRRGGYELASRVWGCQMRPHRNQGDQTVSTRRTHSSYVFQAVNCQATIDQSLRDEASSLTFLWQGGGVLKIRC